MNQALFCDRFVELLGIEIGGDGSSDSPQWKISETPKDTQVAEPSGRDATSRPQATARARGSGTVLWSRGHACGFAVSDISCMAGLIAREATFPP